MIDEEAHLRERFAQLRSEERRGVPPFHSPRAAWSRPRPWRWIAAAAALLLMVVVVVITIRPRPTTFSASDRAAVRSVAQWHPPTDFLLHTPGNDLLSTTPRIPDLKGIPQ